MYYLFIWDKELARKGEDGALYKVVIPIDLAKYFFALDREEYPILSSLSFDDYDLFSDEELDVLLSELERVLDEDCGFRESLRSIIDLINRAKKMKMSVLFDPFRRQ